MLWTSSTPKEEQEFYVDNGSTTTIQMILEGWYELRLQRMNNNFMLTALQPSGWFLKDAVSFVDSKGWTRTLCWQHYSHPDDSWRMPWTSETPKTNQNFMLAMTASTWVDSVSTLGNSATLASSLEKSLMVLWSTKLNPQRCYPGRTGLNPGAQWLCQLEV